MAQVTENTAPTQTVPTNGSGSTGRRPGVPNVAVTWGLRAASTLPSTPRGNRTSEVHNLLEQIKAEGAGRPFELGVYGDDERAQGSAAAKASALRKQYKAADGWQFRVGDSESEPGHVALYVQYGG